MKESLIKFETAVLAKEVGFDVEYFSMECSYFYTNTKSKMFGVDEEGRYYDIKNTSKKLYKRGEEATLNDKNVYLAPTQSLLQKWLRDEHKFVVEIGFYDWGKWNYTIYNPSPIKQSSPEFNTYEEALENGLFKCLNIIKDGTTA